MLPCLEVQFERVGYVDIAVFCDVVEEASAWSSPDMAASVTLIFSSIGLLYFGGGYLLNR